MDKHNWLRRKTNIAKQFEESLLTVKLFERRQYDIRKNFWT